MSAPTMTLAEMRTLPAVVDVSTAARALGIAPSTAYEWIRIGQFPVQVISVRGRRRVVTAGLLHLLGDTGTAGPSPPGPADHHTATTTLAKRTR
jgi:hypothetical protein